MPSFWRLAPKSFALLLSFALLFSVAAAIGVGGQASAQPVLVEPVRPLRAPIGLDPARVALGRVLFHDARLSSGKTHSCASCHQLGHSGADTLARSRGPGGVATRFNTPSIFNSTLNYRQGWLGASNAPSGVLDHVFASDGSAQVSPWTVVAARLSGDTAISKQFSQIYGDAINAARVQDALEHYLRSLLTPSRFDRYLRGERSALSVEERAGYARFKSFGCVSCHQGLNVGGNMYQRLGAMHALVPGTALAADLGRYTLTRRPADQHVFRVPSLRNVALTAPYFHDGSIATLEEAVNAMFKYQLAREALPQDRDLIIRFLKSLSGEQMPPPGATP